MQATAKVFRAGGDAGNANSTVGLPSAIPAKSPRGNEEQGNASECQQALRIDSSPASLAEIADQRLKPNGRQKRLAVKRFVGSSPIASTLRRRSEPLSFGRAGHAQGPDATKVQPARSVTGP